MLHEWEAEVVRDLFHHIAEAQREFDQSSPPWRLQQMVNTVLMVWTDRLPSRLPPTTPDVTDGATCLRALDLLRARLRELMGEKSHDALDWSRAESPSRIAKVLNCDYKTFKRWVDAGKYRVRKISQRRIQIALVDVPVTARPRLE